MATLTDALTKKRLETLGLLGFMQEQQEDWAAGDPPDHDTAAFYATIVEFLQAHGYAPPGKVLVSIETLSELTWCAAGGKHCAGEKCKAFAHCDQKMVAAYPEQTCRDAWLAHLGLGEEGGDK